jgi:flagellar motor switch protein FliN/FliY
MDLTENTAIDDLLDDFDVEEAPAAATAQPAAPRRDLGQMMRKIPVTVSLEVGAAKVSLHDVVNISEGSVIELDTLAGEPLVIRVNGTPIGRAEVVVSGENYGLRVVELADLDLDTLAP